MEEELVEEPANALQPITVTLDGDELELLGAMFFQVDHTCDSGPVSFDNDQEALDRLAAKLGISRQWS